MTRSPGAATRREFLARAVPASLAMGGGIDALAGLPNLRPATQEYWDVVRDAFLIPAGRIYLNVGTLGAQPRAVVDAVAEHTRRVASSYPPATDWDGLKKTLGTLLHADPAGFVFPRNTTEGMSFVANGLEFRAGDEILTTDHEHIGGLCPWQLVAKRHGLALRQLPLPVPHPADDAVVDLFRRALTARTRVISVSHVLFTTGYIMPVAALARLCRERNVILVVDGAHPPGLMPVDLRALDADFYASSPHKWLLAPQGTGLLWMREEWRTKLWPTLASGGWDDMTLGAHRFNHLGTLDESRLAGLDAALRFHIALGPERVVARVRALRDRLLEALRAHPAVHIVSPADARAAGMVSFRVDGIEALELQRRLSDIDAGGGRRISVRTRVIGEYNYNWMRLSPHVYNSPADLDEAVRLIDAARRA